MKLELQTSNLSCARHLFLRSLLYSPFTDAQLLQYIFIDYQRMTEEPATTEDEKLENAKQAKKQLVDDIAKRVHLHSLLRNLSVMHHSTTDDLLSRISTKGLFDIFQ